MLRIRSPVLLVVVAGSHAAEIEVVAMVGNVALTNEVVVAVAK